MCSKFVVKPNWLELIIIKRPLTPLPPTPCLVPLPSPIAINSASSRARGSLNTDCFNRHRYGNDATFPSWGPIKRYL